MANRVETSGTFVFDGGDCTFTSAGGATVSFKDVLSHPPTHTLLMSILGAGVADMIGEMGMPASAASTAVPTTESFPGYDPNAANAFLDRMNESFHKQAGLGGGK